MSRDLPLRSQDRRALSYAYRNEKRERERKTTRRYMKIAGLEYDYVDCRAPQGITIGLVDSLIFICRVLSPRLINEEISFELEEALIDLRQDEDVRRVVGR